MLMMEQQKVRKPRRVPGMRKDIIGHRFSKLVAIKWVGPGSAWLFKCDCGKETVTNACSVKNGSTKSCGCLKHEYKRWIDITGKRFGRLEVIRRLEHVPGKTRKWLCLCDCGRDSLQTQNTLKNGVQSCGCLQKEVAAAIGKRQRIEELGDLQGAERRRAWNKIHYQKSPRYRAMFRAANAVREGRIKQNTPPEQRLTAKQWVAIQECGAGRCTYCNEKPDRLTMDHIVPFARGGQHVWQNVVPACKTCNSRKKDRELGAALIFLQADPEHFWAVVKRIEERLAS